MQPPTKDDISSLLNRQRAHCTLCRVVIKKASGGKKSQWWFSLMVVRAIHRDEDVIVVLIDMCVHSGWLAGCINCMGGKGGPATWWWWKQAGSPASRGRGSLLLLHGSPTATPPAQGLKDTRSEGPLIGLPTSTDLPPEGRSSTHAAQAQRRPSNVLPLPPMCPPCSLSS